MTASLAVVPGAEALVVVVAKVSAAPMGCGRGAGYCADSALLLWTFCLRHDPGPLHLNL